MSNKSDDFDKFFTRDTGVPTSASSRVAPGIKQRAQPARTAAGDVEDIFGNVAQPPPAWDRKGDDFDSFFNEAPVPPSSGSRAKTAPVLPSTKSTSPSPSHIAAPPKISSPRSTTSSKSSPSPTRTKSPSTTAAPAVPMDFDLPNLSEISDNPIPPTTPAAKRGRGRPKKTSGTSTSTTPTPKRGRGRPKKTPGTPTSTSKKTPGTPRVNRKKEQDSRAAAEGVAPIPSKYKTIDERETWLRQAISDNSAGRPIDRPKRGRPPSSSPKSKSARKPRTPKSTTKPTPKRKSSSKAKSPPKSSSPKKGGRKKMTLKEKGPDYKFKSFKKINPGKEDETVVALYYSGAFAEAEYNQKTHAGELFRILTKSSSFAVSASETGAGKTFITLRLFQILRKSLKLQHLIVVGPKSAYSTWEKWVREYHIKNVHFVTYNALSGKQSYGQKQIQYENEGKRATGTLKDGPEVGKADGLYNMSHPLLYRRDNHSENNRHTFKYFPTRRLNQIVVDEGALVVFDECHRMKNPTSGISKACRTLSRFVIECGSKDRKGKDEDGNERTGKGASKALYLSATPFDKPAHARSFLMSFGVINKSKMYGPAGENGKARAPGEKGVAETTYHGYGLGRLINWSRHFNKSSTEAIMRKYDFSDLKNLNMDVVIFDFFTNVIRPATIRTLHRPPLPDDIKPDYMNLILYMDPDELENYRQKIRNVLENGVDLPNGRRTGLIRADTKREVETAKRNGILRLIQRKNADPAYRNAKFIVYQYYKENIDFFMKELLKLWPGKDGNGNPRVARFDGDTAIGERSGIVDDFNAPNLELKAIVGSVPAAKESISLHDTNGRFKRVMIIGTDFNFIDSVQAAGRVERVGMKSKPEIIFTYGGEAGLDLMYMIKSINSSKVVKATLGDLGKLSVLPSDYRLYQENSNGSLTELSMERIMAEAEEKEVMNVNVDVVAGEVEVASKRGRGRGRGRTRG